MGFSRQAYCNGLPFPSSGDLPGPGTEPGSLMSTCIKKVHSLPCICMAESLRCPPETITTLLINCGGSLVAQSCPTLCDPLDCSPPGSSVHGILQASILEGVAISFSRESSSPKDPPCVFCIAGGFFTIESPGTPSFQGLYLKISLCGQKPQGDRFTGKLCIVVQ